MATINIDPAPQEGAWGIQWKNWLSKLRDKIVAYFGVIDLTSATSDYTLGVGQVAKIDITASSTALKIGVEDGVYELWIIFEPSSFNANSEVYLKPNNADQTNIEGSAIRFSPDVATDEIDVVSETTSTRVVFRFADCIPRSVKSTICKFDEEATFQTTTHCQVSSQETHVLNYRWPGASSWTSLGTLFLSEAADGVCYVKRIA